MPGVVGSSERRASREASLSRARRAAASLSRSGVDTSSSASVRRAARRRRSSSRETSREASLELAREAAAELARSGVDITSSEAIQQEAARRRGSGSTHYGTAPVPTGTSEKIKQAISEKGSTKYADPYAQQKRVFKEFAKSHGSHDKSKYDMFGNKYKQSQRKKAALQEELRKDLISKKYFKKTQAWTARQMAKLHTAEEKAMKKAKKDEVPGRAAITFATGAAETFVGLPEYAGSVIVGGEMALRHPKKFSKAAVPATVSMVKSLAEGAKADPIRTAGQVAGMVALGKVAGKGGKIIKEKLPYTVKLTEPKQILLEGKTIKITTETKSTSRLPIKHTGKTEQLVYVEETGKGVGKLNLKLTPEQAKLISKGYEVAPLERISTSQGSFYRIRVRKPKSKPATKDYYKIETTERKPIGLTQWSKTSKSRWNTLSKKFKQIKPHVEKKVKLSRADINLIEKLTKEAKDVKGTKSTRGSRIVQPTLLEDLIKLKRKSKKLTTTARDKKLTTTARDKKLLGRRKITDLEVDLLLQRKKGGLSKVTPSKKVKAPSDVRLTLDKPKETVIHAEHLSTRKPKKTQLTYAEKQKRAKVAYVERPTVDLQYLESMQVVPLKPKRILKPKTKPKDKTRAKTNGKPKYEARTRRTSKRKGKTAFIPVISFKTTAKDKPEDKDKKYPIGFPKDQFKDETKDKTTAGTKPKTEGKTATNDKNKWRSGRYEKTTIKEKRKVPRVTPKKKPKKPKKKKKSKRKEDYYQFVNPIASIEEMMGMSKPKRKR